jgi:hypothetical protein
MRFIFNEYVMNEYELIAEFYDFVIWIYEKRLRKMILMFDPYDVIKFDLMINELKKHRYSFSYVLLAFRILNAYKSYLLKFSLWK